MIHPVTFVTLLAAGTSGLFLYQTKHRSEVLDRRIEQTLRGVSATRDHIGLLQAEWALLNEPERLGQLAAQHLSLQPLTPSRFVSIADLEAHLPPPGSPETVADGSASEETDTAASSAPAALVTVTPSAPVRMIDAAPIQAAARPAPAPSPAAARPAQPVQLAAVRVPRPRPIRANAERAPGTQRDGGHPSARTAGSAPDSSPPAATRPAVIAPVLQAAAMPPMAAVGAARLPAPTMASALGGYGRSTLAPPVPVGSR